MPTALNGDVRFHVSIVDWLGATQVSKPCPVKPPGACGPAAPAGDDDKIEATRPVTTLAIVKRKVGEDGRRMG